MLEKIIGVSPSQKGVTQDSKKPESSTIKNDFEKVLQTRIQSKPKKQESKSSNDEEKEDLKALKKEKSSEKASRGNKKRMNEDDDSASENLLMISNIMASIENEVEIPDEEKQLAKINIEDVSEVKTDLGKKIKDQLVNLDSSTLSKLSEKLKEALTLKLPGQEKLIQELSDPKSPSDMAAALALIKKLLAENQTIDSKHQDKIVAVDETQLQTEGLPLAQTAVQGQNDLQIKNQQQQVQAEQAIEDHGVIPDSDAKKDFSADLKMQVQRDLSARTEDANQQKPEKVEDAHKQTQIESSQEDNQQKDLASTIDDNDPQFLKVLEKTGVLTQLKSFEESKGLRGDKAKAFEQNVLHQLKQEYAEMTTKVSGHRQNENFSNLSHDKNETFDKSFVDTKPDALKSDGLLHVGQVHNDFRSQMVDKPEALMKSTLSQMEAHHDKNVQEIMKQAQYLIKQGGGEMKVSMSPDGISEVQLKVMLDGGKVNIEMQTTDRSVKKMIEDSLSELRSGLAAHKLSVEHVKIDTVNATNTEQRTGLQTNLGQSGAQYESREFWKQFQENFGNNARKSSYSEVSNVSSSVQNPKPLSSSRQQSYRSNGRTGSTLNQVA